MRRIAATARVVQVNTTDWQQFSLDVGGVVGGGVFELHGVGSSQDYYQTFSAVAAAPRPAAPPSA